MVFLWFSKYPIFIHRNLLHLQAIGWFEDFLRNRDPTAAPRESYVQERWAVAELATLAGICSFFWLKRWFPNEVKLEKHVEERKNW